MFKLSMLGQSDSLDCIGLAALLIPALAEGMVEQIPQYTLLDWGCIAYLGVFGTVLGFVWYYEGIKALGPTKAGQFINFVPVCASLLAKTNQRRHPWVIMPGRGTPPTATSV